MGRLLMGDPRIALSWLKASSVGAKTVRFAFSSMSASVKPAFSIACESEVKEPFDANVTASGADATLGALRTESITWIMPFEATMSVVTMLDESIIRPASPSDIIASSPFAISTDVPAAAIASIDVTSAPATTW